MDFKKSNLHGIIYDTIEEYSINKYIAVGGESIVFKGEKRSVGRTYALKFRQMDRWSDFCNFEMKTLSRLEQCSTSKLAGVIPTITNETLQTIFRMIPEDKKARCKDLISPYAQYFCIVEDYISGCDLNEYCLAHTPPMNASYEQVVDFQRKLLNWTKQYCEIMSHVTGDNKFLHLDIKPENIMISNETESVTVIDFGKSMEIKNSSGIVSLTHEFGDNIGVYGTNGFAAPECCDSVQMRNSLNLPTTGEVDLRSDIFSFGASLWDCINPMPNLRIKSNEQGYFRRDLFMAPKGYIPELEAIIVKCTEKKPEDRFQSYEELKAAAVYAEKKLLERDKPRKTLLICSVLTSVLTALLILAIAVNGRRADLAFERARHNFDEMAESYSEHNISEYKETALALIEADPSKPESYYDILKVAYKDDNNVSKTELEDVIFKCLDQAGDEEIKKKCVNEIMQHVNEVSAKSVAQSLSLRSSLNKLECDGMIIADAMANYDAHPIKAYKTLEEYKDSKEYHDVLVTLEKMLFNDSNIRAKIAKSKNISADKLERPLSIGE